MTIINRPVTGATRTMKRIVPLLGFAVALLSMPAAADLVGLYTFDGANPLEAVIGSPAKEGVTTGNNQQPVLSDTIATISLVNDATVLGTRTGVVAVPSRSTLAIPNPGLRKNWTIVLPFYCPANATWRCFFKLNNGADKDGSLFIHNNTDIGASSYTKGLSGMIGAWHQLTVSSANGTQTVWYDTTKLEQTRSWDIAGLSLLLFSFDNNGEDSPMYLDDIRLYDETSPAEVFPGGVSERPILFDPWSESSYTDDWGSFSRTPDQVIDDMPYRTYIFSRHGSFTFAPNKASAGAKVLLVGGGGAGGLQRGGGGGGGGVVFASDVSFLAQSYTATVGAGGIPAIHTYWYSDAADNSKLHEGITPAAACGGDTMLAAGGSVLFTAHGGGGGGNFNYAGSNQPSESYGLPGGSGGGSSGKSTVRAAGIDGEGHAGGAATTDGDNSAGGGGGAGAAGADGTKDNPGAGGTGVENSITGVAVFYGGGGGAGGGYSGNNVGAGGAGGGGTGVSSSSVRARTTAANGVDGLGGGGGGGSGQNNNPICSMGGRGGDGTVILRVSVVDDSDPTPTLALTADPVSYTNATLSARLIAFGSGASQATVSLVVSAMADLSNPIFSGVLATDATDLDDFPHTLFGLATNTTYYAQATAVNNRNATGVSALVSFNTLDPEPPAVGAAPAGAGFGTISATATLASFGAGSIDATVYLDCSRAGDFSDTVSSPGVAVSALPSSQVLTATGLEVGVNYAYRVRAVNTWGHEGVSATFEAATKVAPVSLSEISVTPTGTGAESIAVSTLAIESGATYEVSLAIDGATVRSWASQTELGTFSVSYPTAGTHSAVATVVCEFGGQTFTDSRSVSFTTGRSRVVVADYAEHCSAAAAIRVHPGDTIVLPELLYGWSYRVLNERFLSLGGLEVAALEPAVAGIEVYNGSLLIATVAVLVLPEAIEGGDVYVYNEKASESERWNRAATWEKIGSATDGEFPSCPNDIAVIPFYDTTSRYVRHDTDLSLGGILFGNFRDIEAAVYLERHSSVTTKTITFERTDEDPAFVKVTPNTTAARTQTLRFGGSDILVNCVSSVIADSCSDTTDADLNRGKITYEKCTVHIPEGRYWAIDGIPGYDLNMGGTIGPPKLTGAGTFWKKGMGGITFENASLAFEGTLLDTSHGHIAGFNRAGPIYWKKGNGTNICVTVAGRVHPQLGSPSDSKKGYGYFRTGWEHGYGEPAEVHPDEPWNPRKTMTMRGGVYHAYYAANGNWGVGVRDTRLFEKLIVGPGMSYVQENAGNNSGGNPINCIEWDAIGHEGKGTLVITDPSRRSAAPSSTNTMTIVKNHDAFLVGAGEDGDCLSSDVYPVIPWIVASTTTDDSNWRNTMFASFDEDGCLTRPVWNNTKLDEVASPFSNAYVWDKTIEISSNVVVNSLFMNNSGKGKWLGEDRKLTITSGGLVMHNNGTAIGQPGRTDNGLLVLGDADHPAYIFAKASDASQPNQIWAAVTAPGGFVASYSGALVLGGDQTGIAGEIVVNAGVLTLGTAALACELSEGHDVVVRAGAKLVVAHEDGLAGQIVRLDGAGGAPGTLELSADTACAKLYLRDWPASPEWTALPRGTYGSSASTAEYKDDARFSGTGMITILADETSGPDIANLSLVTLDDRSATIGFDLWPGFGSDLIDVYALWPVDGEGPVTTNLIFSSVEPVDGHFEGTVTGLEPETTYTVRLLAVNESRGEEFSAESPDTLEFTTVSFDATPEVRLDVASAIGTGDVTFPWALLRTGSGRSIVSIRLYWAESEVMLDDLSVCAFLEIPAADCVPGNHETTISPLRPGTSFYALLVAENDGEADNVTTSGPVAFATRAEVLSGARPLNLGSCIRTTDGLTVIVSAPAGEPAFTDVFAVWAVKHAGEDLDAWDNVPLRIGDMGTAAASLEAFIPTASLGDAIYVRFAGRSAEGELSWSESYYLPDILIVSDIPPNVAVGSIAPGGNDVTLSAYVLSVGSLSQNDHVDISLEYALDPEAFSDGSLAKVWSVPFTNGVPVGAVAPVRVGNLRAERRYYARFVGENDHNQRGAGDVFTFDTLAGDGGSVDASDWGLRQMRLPAGSGNADGLDAMVWDETKADGVEGAVMAYRYNLTPWASDKSGASYVWGNNIGFFYKGWIFLEGGTTYTIGSSIDDSCIVMIGGSEVLRQVKWDNRRTFGAFTPDETTWYEFEVRMGNGSGGAGAGEDGNTFGLGWNTTSTRTVSASAMQPFLDPGDGSFLRPSADRTLTVVSTELVSGGVSATVAFTAGLPAGTLRAFWGAETLDPAAAARRLADPARGGFRHDRRRPHDRLRRGFEPRLGRRLRPPSSLGLRGRPLRRGRHEPLGRRRRRVRGDRPGRPRHERLVAACRHHGRRRLRRDASRGVPDQGRLRPRRRRVRHLRLAPRHDGHGNARRPRRGRDDRLALVRRGRRHQQLCADHRNARHEVRRVLARGNRSRPAAHGLLPDSLRQHRARRHRVDERERRLHGHDRRRRDLHLEAREDRGTLGRPGELDSLRRARSHGPERRPRLPG